MPTDFSKLITATKSGEAMKAPALPDSYDKRLAGAIHEVDLDTYYQKGTYTQGRISRYPVYVPGASQAMFADKQSSGEVRKNAWKQFSSTFWDTYTGQLVGAKMEAINDLSRFNFSELWKSDVGEAAGSNMLYTRAKYPIYETRDEIANRGKSPGLFRSIGKYLPYVGDKPGRAWARTLADSGFTLGGVAAIGTELVVEAGVWAGIGASSGAAAGSTVGPGGTAAGAAAGGTLGLIKGAISGLRKGFKLFNQARQFNKLKRTVQTTKDLLGKSKSLAKSINRANVVKGFGTAGINALRLGNQTTFEAGVEAGIVRQEFIEDQILKFKKENNGRNPNFEELEQIGQLAGEAADATFTGNMAVLTVSNALMIGTLFGRSLVPKFFGRASRYMRKKNPFSSAIVAKGGKFQLYKDVTRKAIEKRLGKYGAKGVYGMLALTKFVGTNTFREGMEEVMQGAISEGAKKYYDMYDDEYGRSSREIFRAMGDAYSENFKTGRAWDEFVAGGIMGLMMGGIGGSVSYARGTTQKQQDQKARDFAKQLTKDAVQTYEDYFDKIDFRTYMEQVASATNLDVAEAEGDTKKMKDIRAQARASLFRKMHNAGYAEEYLELLFEEAELRGETDPGSLQEFYNSLGVKESIEGLSQEQRDALAQSAKDDLMQQFEAYSQVKDAYMTAGGTTLGNKATKEELEALELAAHFLATNEHNITDIENRMGNLRSDLSSLLLSNNSTSERATNVSRVEAMIDAILDPQSFKTYVANERAALAASEELLAQTELSEADKTQREQDIAKQKRWVETLTNIESTIFDSQGNLKEYNQADQIEAITEIYGAIAQYAPEASSREFLDLFKDFMYLNAEIESLNFFSRALTEVDERKVIMDIIKEKRKHKAKTKTKKVEKIERAKGVEADVLYSEKMSEEEFIEAIKGSELDKNSIQTLLSKLSNLKKNNSDKYVVGSEQFDTLEEAQDRIIESFPDAEVKEYAEAFKKRANGIMNEKIPAAQAKESKAKIDEARENERKVEKEINKQNEVSGRKIDSEKKLDEEINKLKKEVSEAEKAEKKGTKAEKKAAKAKKEQAQEAIQTLEASRASIKLMDSIMEKIRNTQGMEKAMAVFEFEQNSELNRIFPTVELIEEVAEAREDLEETGYTIETEELGVLPENIDEENIEYVDTENLPQGALVIAENIKPRITYEGAVKQQPKVKVARGIGQDNLELAEAITKSNEANAAYQDNKKSKQLRDAAETAAQKVRSLRQDIAAEAKENISTIFDKRPVKAEQKTEAQPTKAEQKTEAKAVEEDKKPETKESKPSTAAHLQQPLSEQGVVSEATRQKSTYTRNKNHIFSIFSNIAFARMFTGVDLSTKFIAKQKKDSPVQNLLKAINNSMDEMSLMVISFNPDVISEGVIDISNLKKGGVKSQAKDITQRLNNGELVVLRDDQNRLIVLRKGDTSALTESLRTQHELIRTPNQTLVKGRNLFGKVAVVESTILDETMTDESAAEIAKTQKGDTVQLRVAHDSYNQNLIRDLENGDITEEYAADQLKIIMYRNGVPVGIIPAGDINNVDNEGKSRANTLRAKLEVADKLLGQYRQLQSEVVIGTIQVSFRQDRHNYLYEISEGGRIVVDTNQTLASFERAVKETFGDKVEIDYLVAESTNLAKDQKGKDVTLDEAGRTSFHKGAVYVRVRHQDGTVTTQQAFTKPIKRTAEQIVEQDASLVSPATETIENSPEVIKGADFKTQFYTILNPRGPKFKLSSRLALNIGTFKESSLTETNIEKLNRSFAQNKSKKGVNVVINENFSIPLLNATRDNAKGIVSGILPATNEEFKISDNDIKTFAKFKASPKAKKSSKSDEAAKNQQSAANLSERLKNCKT